MLKLLEGFMKTVAMPKIAEKDGLVVKVMTRFGKHLAPYIKVEKAEYKASFRIDTGEMVVGNLPNKYIDIIDDYIASNREQLLESFNDALSGNTPRKVPFSKTVASIPKLKEVWGIGSVIYGRFSNGRELCLDVKDILLNLPGDMVQPLRNPEYFAKLKTDGEIIYWPNEFEIEVEDFYDLAIPFRAVAKT